MLAQVLKGVGVHRTGDNQGLITPVKPGGLHPRQQPPGVVKVTMGQQHGSHTSAAQPRRAQFGFQVATRGGESVLEAFSGVDDDQAFRTRQNRPADRPLAGRPGGSGPKHVEVQHRSTSGKRNRGLREPAQNNDVPDAADPSPWNRDVNALLDQFCGRLGHEKMGTGHAVQIDDRVVHATQPTSIGEEDLLATHRADVHDPPSSAKKGVRP